MYQGKHYKKSRKRSKRSLALLVSLCLIVGLSVGGTVAFLMDTAGPVENKFTPSQVTTKVEETLDGTTKKDVYIQNTGDTDAWIRAAVVVTWQDSAGNVYGQKPVAGTNYTAWNPGNNWKEGNDGFYYYIKPVVAGGQTGDELITEIAPIGDPPVADYYLTVEIIGSGIQSKPASVFNTEWASSGLAVNTKDQQGNELPPEQWALQQGGAGE